MLPEIKLHSMRPRDFKKQMKLIFMENKNAQSQ